MQPVAHMDRRRLLQVLYDVTSNWFLSKLSSTPGELQAVQGLS
jgi:hypothetical protein